MHERELYERLLGLSAPWFVADVKLNTVAQQVDVFVEHSRGTSFSCPECGKACPVYDHTAERQWRHLDTMQFKTMLHAKPPRVRCQCAHTIATLAALASLGQERFFTLTTEADHGPGRGPTEVSRVARAAEAV